MGFLFFCILTAHSDQIELTKKCRICKSPNRKSCSDPRQHAQMYTDFHLRSSKLQNTFVMVEKFFFFFLRRAVCQAILTGRQLFASLEMKDGPRMSYD